MIASFSTRLALLIQSSHQLHCQLKSRFLIIVGLLFLMLTMIFAQPVWGQDESTKTTGQESDSELSAPEQVDVQPVALDEKQISMPDEAREVIFPQGVPLFSVPTERDSATVAGSGIVQPMNDSTPPDPLSPRQKEDCVTRMNRFTNRRGVLVCRKKERIC